MGRYWRLSAFGPFVNCISRGPWVHRAPLHTDFSQNYLSQWLPDSWVAAIDKHSLIIYCVSKFTQDSFCNLNNGILVADFWLTFKKIFNLVCNHPKNIIELAISVCQYKTDISALSKVSPTSIETSCMYVPRPLMPFLLRYTFNYVRVRITKIKLN